jgi:hypothetical protein
MSGIRRFTPLLGALSAVLLAFLTWYASGNREKRDLEEMGHGYLFQGHFIGTPPYLAVVLFALAGILVIWGLIRVLRASASPL